MTRLRFLGRDLPVASDDLVVPYGFRFIVKMGLISIGYCTLNPEIWSTLSKCDMSALRRGILLCVITLCICAACDALVAITSYRGTMGDDRPRRHMVGLLYLSTLAFVADLAFSVGLPMSYIVSRVFESPECFTRRSSRMTELLASLKLITDFAWIFVLAAILLSSTPNESFSGPSEMKTWRKRLEIIYGQKVPDTGFVQEPYLKDVLQYLSALLSEVISEIDFTASDLMAGIILVAKRRSRIGKLLPQSAEERGNSDTVEKPLASIGEISHLFQFAEMTYGTPGHAFRRLVQFTIRMICPLFFQPMLHTSSIEADFSTLPSKVIHDDRSSNVANRSAGRGCRSPPDLIFCSRKNSLFEIPFAILCDSCCKSVIITIRGTLSISDLFVDLYTDMSPLKFPNLPADPEVYYAHSGFLRCALNVKEKIISSGILSMIFAENSRHKNYSLTVIGHSLGAAVATLLTYLLRVHHTEFPPARCIAYSPPGAIMSPSASEEVKAYVLSVVIGYDFISRLTKESVVNLLSDIEGAINNSGQKKIRVLWRYMFPSRLRPRRSNKQHTHAGSVLAGSEVSDSNDRRKDLHDSIETYPIGLAPSFKKQPKTAIAGKILHIIPIRPRTLYRPTRSAKCIAVWGKKEDFYDIAIESSMFNTHIPQYAAQFFSPDALYSYPKELGDFSGMPHSEE